MDNKMIWAALSDGRYLRIFFHQDDAENFVPLRFETLPAYAELNYLMVNNKPLNAKDDATRAKKIDYIQCHATFLEAQQDLFNALIITAPKDMLFPFKMALSASLQSLIIGELTEDLTAQSSDIIERRLGEFI